MCPTQKRLPAEHSGPALAPSTEMGQMPRRLRVFAGSVDNLVGWAKKSGNGGIAAGLLERAANSLRNK